MRHNATSPALRIYVCTWKKVRSRGEIFEGMPHRKTLGNPGGGEIQYSPYGLADVK